MRTVWTSFIVLLWLTAFGPNALRLDASLAAATPGPQDALHQVMPGDNLHLIAGYYYGDARQWERIWQANRDRVRNPNRIERGTLLLIPGAAVPAEPYADFVARARRSGGFPGVQAQAEGAPEVEVRASGEGSSAPMGTSAGVPGGPAARTEPAAPPPAATPGGPTAVPLPAPPPAPRP